jgi:hypothetical protein
VGGVGAEEGKEIKNDQESVAMGSYVVENPNFDEYCKQIKKNYTNKKQCVFWRFSGGEFPPPGVVGICGWELIIM